MRKINPMQDRIKAVLERPAVSAYFVGTVDTEGNIEYVYDMEFADAALLLLLAQADVARRSEAALPTTVTLTPPDAP